MTGKTDKTSVLVVDYGMGNIRSIRNALVRLGCEVTTSDRAEDILFADAIILPGVGAFEDGMKSLNNLGLVEPLTKLVLDEQKPILAICLGFQLLANESHEFGLHKGLGWIDAEVKKIDTKNSDLRVPHVGWNEINFSKNSFLFEGLENKSDCYFVHSYHLTCHDSEDVVGTTPYCGGFVSVINRKACY